MAPKPSNQSMKILELDILDIVLKVAFFRQPQGFHNLVNNFKRFCFENNMAWFGLVCGV
jgi:hypothetical protein